MYPLDDTIAAAASPPGGAARGIVRVSGPKAIECVARFFRPDDGRATAEPIQPTAVSGSLVFDDLASPLPCEAYLWPDKKSYTGQPVAELHTIGSPPLLQIVLNRLTEAGARAAGPGEFTLRAFLSGRIDLSQAEAVLGVIDATDRRELNVALRQLAGGLARPLHRLRDLLVDLLSHLEAGFDFADEEIPFIQRDELLARLTEAEKIIAETLAQMDARGDSVDLETVVLIGRANVGKSSLFNVLAADRAALVCDVPGTTRDYLTAELDLDGVKCRLIDTAGMRGERREERGEGKTPPDCGPGGGIELDNEIDSAAQSAAAEQFRDANIQVLCIDSTRRPDVWEISRLCEVVDRHRIVVKTKCDLQKDYFIGCRSRKPIVSVTEIASYIKTSSTTGEGIDRLRDELRRKVLISRAGRSETVAETAVRCRESLRAAGECVERARGTASAGQDELSAAEVRVALDELGKIVGAVYTDDMLDRIFSRFCIGK